MFDKPSPALKRHFLCIQGAMIAQRYGRETRPFVRFSVMPTPDCAAELLNAIHGVWHTIDGADAPRRKAGRKQPSVHVADDAVLTKLYNSCLKLLEPEPSPETPWESQPLYPRHVGKAMDCDKRTALDQLQNIGAVVKTLSDNRIVVNLDIVAEKMTKDIAEGIASYQPEPRKKRKPAH